MAWKRPARREFLKGGAALASGLTVGAVAPAAAQGPASPASPAPSSPPMHRDNNDEIRVRRALQARHLGAHSAREQAVARQFRADVSRGDATSGPGRGDYAILAPLLRDDPRLVPPGHQSPVSTR